MEREADEIKAEYVRLFGDEGGRLFFHLQQELIFLHAKWKQYEELFAASEARIDALNRVAGFFFGLLEDVMWDDILLHIGRLTDRPGTGNRSNLTVQRLPDVFLNTPLHKEIDDLVQAAVAASGFLRDWRNKGIAHRDLQQVLDQGAQPLSRGSRQQVDDALAALRGVLNRVDQHYLHFDTSYSYTLLNAGADVQGLLYHLGEALHVLEERQRRLLEGQPLPGDLKRVPTI